MQAILELISICIVQLVSAAWHSLSEADRAPYYDLASKDKDRYDKGEASVFLLLKCAYRDGNLCSPCRAAER